MKQRQLQKIHIKYISLILAAIIPFSFLGTLFRVEARTAEEIAADIVQKQKELDQLNKDLLAAQKEVNSSMSKQKSSLNTIAGVKSQLDQVDSSLKLNELKIQELESKINLKELEHEEKKSQQDKQVIDSYITWKTDDITAKLLAGEEDVLKTYMYFDIVTYNSNQQILGIAAELSDLNKQNDVYQKEKTQLNIDMVSYQEQKKLLEKQIAAYNDAIARANKNADGIRAKTNIVQQQKSDLDQELREAEVAPPPGGGGTEPLVSGQLYFAGSVMNSPGNPSYDAFGHGIGLSQFGAYGAANAGWSAEKIVTFYFSNTRVEARPGMNISIVNYGTISVEDYVSGLGEVPSRACGTMDQITAWNTYANQQGWAPDDPRRNKYVIDNPSSVWDCWPEEAIKAQVMAARSYGITSAQPICTTASCQVYIGGKAKAWAAWETKDKYIVSNGPTHTNQVIRAYYSSYNSNGTGTADNETNWPASRAGGGSPYSYLRSVNDSAFTYRPYGRTSWRSNSYSIAEMNSMIAWCATSGNCTSWQWMRDNVRNKIGQLQSMTTIKDASGRVKQVVVKGTSGQATMSGQYFRSVFNLWASKVKANGADAIGGITFSILTAQ